MTDPAAAVIGAGILGVSTAVHLARRGAPVALITDGAPGSGASGRSLAWLNSAAADDPGYHQLRTLGMERYRGYAAEHPEAGVHFAGGLSWAAPGESQRDRHQNQQQLGYPGEWLDRDAVGARFAAVDPDAVADEGALFNPGEGWVDLPRLLDSLLAEFDALGGTVVSDCRRAQVLTNHGRVSGVQTGAGHRIGTGRVLIAAGAATPDLTAALGFRLPDATTIGAMAVVRPAEPCSLEVVLNAPRVAIRPMTAGKLAIGAHWAEAAAIRHDDDSFELPGSLVEEMLDEATAVLAGHPRLELEAVHVGPRPVPADGRPVLGPLQGVAGCHVAFSHSGATLGLIIGELLADEILDLEPSPMLDAYRPDRFQP